VTASRLDGGNFIIRMAKNYTQVLLIKIGIIFQVKCFGEISVAVIVVLFSCCFVMVNIVCNTAYVYYIVLERGNETNSSAKVKESCIM
jgi:hypothetical protein